MTIDNVVLECDICHKRINGSIGLAGSYYTNRKDVFCCQRCNTTIVTPALKEMLFSQVKEEIKNENLHA